MSRALPKQKKIFQLPFAYVAGMAALVLAFGCKPAATVTKKDEGDKPVRVRTVSLVQTDIERSCVQPATILPFYETEIRSRLSGYVEEVLVDIGDVVEVGQVLARLSVPEMEKRIGASESQVALLKSKELEAEAQVSLAKATVKAASAKLEQARAELLEEEASLAAADAELSRTKDLVQRGSLQQRLLDEAQKKRDSAQASQSAVLSAVQSAEAEVAVAQAAEAGAQAAIVSAKASTSVAVMQLEEQMVLLSYAELKSPFAGVVTERHVSVGDLMRGTLEAGSATLFVLHQTNKVRIHVPIPENHAPFVQPGDKLTITFPAFASEPPLEVAVTRVSSSLDASTRTVTAEAEVENPEGKWLPGMFGEATVGLETNVATNMLPARAVRFDEQGKAFVYLVDANNSVTIAEVQTGMDTGNEIEILSGVDLGQTVIGPHLARFTEGQIVEPL
ncbi:MAG: efflux RND transporter periplasmic adaptor subunit [Planctomycetota bacterium]